MHGQLYNNKAKLAKLLVTWWHAKWLWSRLIVIISHSWVLLTTSRVSLCTIMSVNMTILRLHWVFLEEWTKMVINSSKRSRFIFKSLWHGNNLKTLFSFEPYEVICKSVLFSSVHLNCVSCRNYEIMMVV